jgi:hypothetical protein
MRYAMENHIKHKAFLLPPGRAKREGRSRQDEGRLNSCIVPPQPNYSRRGALIQCAPVRRIKSKPPRPLRVHPSL